MELLNFGWLSRKRDSKMVGASLYWFTIAANILPQIYSFQHEKYICQSLGDVDLSIRFVVHGSLDSNHTSVTIRRASFILKPPLE